MDIHPLPTPPLSFLRFSSFLGLSFRLFGWFLRFVSLPQSRAKYSLLLHLSFAPALLALLFLSFFLSFRLFRCLFRFFRRSAAKRLSVCVCVSHSVSKSFTLQGDGSPPILPVQRRGYRLVLKQWRTLHCVPASNAMTPLVSLAAVGLFPWWFFA